MTDPRLLTATVVTFSSWPLRAIASSGGNGGTGGDAELTALLGVAAAFAWHHLSRRRGAIATRWHRMHVGDRLPILRLGERLHASHLRAVLSAALHPRIAAASSATASAAPDHPRRVLVVDDDADVRTAIGEALSSEGFTVCEAGDGIEGLRRAREERPDVILLDLMMPQMDGLEFRAVQRADARIASIPVVVISASDAEVGGFGAAAYLHKPFDLRVLLDAVDRYAVAAA